ncbi:Flavin-containing monooxygenase [Phanerochaete sordida]|uniref:Flavin-containing monooxygenase n=1 Tax=Phanerochaete sordida TaxID=48140 RepID=A0A9P3LBB3_9APHY|nr:Flavin-containing monooxygenase [Phanerochaete sordida]
MSVEVLPPAAPALPTFSNLGATPPPDPPAEALARAWVNSFAQSIATNDIPGLVASRLAPDPWWRDVFALTWDLRTFHGRARVSQFLEDRLALTGFGNIAFCSAEYQQPFSDLAWILVSYTFETNVARGRGFARLVYCADNAWHAVALSTQLEGLKRFPELGPADRDARVNQGDWAARRALELQFEEDPQVLVIGAGHVGLEVAARLKHLGVRTLIVEKNARVGDNWRKRYDALTLHDPIWCNHLPYLPFPTSWPVFPSSGKLANWLEFYAEALELNLWLSSEALSTVRNETTGKWDVLVRRADGSERMMHVEHVVLAQGFTFKKTVFPGQDEFKGPIIHSTEFKSGKDMVGKKVVIIGACTSAHDIASDCADYGVDVTMVQRSSTYVMSVEKGIMASLPVAEWEGSPLDEGDQARQSLPFRFQKGFAQRRAVYIQKMEKDLLDGLRKVGYKVNNGMDDAGVLWLLLERGGGYYFDDGACQKIIDGKIKMKSGAEVARLTSGGVAFADGSELEADVVVVATGFDDARVPIRQLVGADVGAKIPPIWGLNEEGELRGPFRELEGLPNMWLMMGNFFWGRFFSKMVAMQIKAKLEGVYDSKYPAPVEW